MNYNGCFGSSEVFQFDVHSDIASFINGFFSVQATLCCAGSVVHLFLSRVVSRLGSVEKNAKHTCSIFFPLSIFIFNDWNFDE